MASKILDEEMVTQIVKRLTDHDFEVFTHTVSAIQRIVIDRPMFYGIIKSEVEKILSQDMPELTHAGRKNWIGIYLLDILRPDDHNILFPFVTQALTFENDDKTMSAAAKMAFTKLFQEGNLHRTDPLYKETVLNLLKQTPNAGPNGHYFAPSPEARLKGLELPKIFQIQIPSKPLHRGCLIVMTQWHNKP